MRLLLIILSKLTELMPFFPAFATVKESAVKYFVDSIETISNLYQALADNAGAIFANTGGTGAAGTFTSICQKISGVSTVWSGTFASLGMVMAFVAWVIAVVDLTIQDRLSPETFVKSFAKLGLGIGLCGATSAIIIGINDFADGFTSDVANLSISQAQYTSSHGGYTNINSASDYNSYMGNDSSSGSGGLFADVGGKEKLMEDMLGDGKGGLVDGLGIYIQAIFFWIPAVAGVTLLTVVMYLIAFSRIIEKAVRETFLGISFGLLADDGWRGPGARYIKKYVAIVCQGGVLTLLCKIYGLAITTAFAAMASALANAGGDINAIGAALSESQMVVWGCGFATLGLMFKSIGILNDLFGA